MIRETNDVRLRPRAPGRIRLLSALLLIIVATPCVAERIKDLASVQGVRANQLLGYGLVVGLDGSGDQVSQVPFTAQSLRSMLTQYGITVPVGVALAPKNVAAVGIHATLPPFAKPGQTIDITVSSLGNAKSLRGGSLLMTVLRGADGEVYAVAQGNVISSGLAVEGQDGTNVAVNVASVGRVPNGATVEKTVETPFTGQGELVFNLHSPDFTTAKRMEDAINSALGPDTAMALDAVSVKVRAPQDASGRVALMAHIENVTLDPGEGSAKIIVNSRSGTIVIGSHVRVMPAAVTHGNLTVTITENPQVSQPNPLSRGGNTEVVPNTNIQVEQEDARMFLFQPGVTLSEIVRAVNQVGAGPSDLVAILEALKQAGALRAQLIII